MTTQSPSVDETVGGFVDADWLLGHLDDPALVLVEVNDQPELYNRGHIPGARNVLWTSELQDPVRRDLPSDEALAELWRRLGVTAKSTVVFYGDLNNWLAAYGCWLFRIAGIKNTQLLDGGRQYWIHRELPLVNERTAGSTPSRRSTKAPVPTWNKDHIADCSMVAAAARSGRLLDVRTPQEYSGQWLTEPEFSGEVAHRPGHIPGAVNIPWDVAVGRDGLLRPRAELVEAWRDLCTDVGGPIVTYCRIGESSAHSWIVLHDVLGVNDVANYAGSWTEWGCMMGMPIELGDQAGRYPDAATRADV